VSGAKDRRPALDQLLVDAKRRRFDVLVCWRLDRLGRSLKHLITLVDDLHALGVAFVSLAEGIDATTPTGKLQMHILGVIAGFERRGSSSAYEPASRGVRPRAAALRGVSHAAVHRARAVSKTSQDDITDCA
jgi:DNA invertase Pin-like site-specific DNA recombinase